MTPERVLKTIADKIILEVSTLEALGQVELMDGYFDAYERVTKKLVDIGNNLGIPICENEARRAWG